MCTIGKRIKERRKLLGLSAEDLAAMVGMSPATIYRYEKGDIKKVDTTKLTPIAQALETTEADLMGWTEATKNNSSTAENFPSNVTPIVSGVDQRKRLHNMIDQLGEEDLPLVIDIVSRFKKND